MSEKVEPVKIKYDGPENDRRIASTDRGFPIYAKFTDRYDHQIHVVKSSLAYEDCVWVFTSDPEHRDANPNPHLNVAQALELIHGLLKFIMDAYGMEVPDGDAGEAEDGGGGA